MVVCFLWNFSKYGVFQKQFKQEGNQPDEQERLIEFVLFGETRCRYPGFFQFGDVVVNAF